MVNVVDGGNAFSSYEDEQYPGFAPSDKSGLDVAISVKRSFGDESGVQLEDTDILRWINDAQREIVNTNKVLKAKATLGTITGVSEYKYPEEDIHQIEGILYDGLALINIPFAQAQSTLFTLPDAQTGHPSYWYEWASTITLWPAPEEEGKLTLFYTKRPDDLVALAEPLQLDDRYYQLIVNYVMAQAYEMDEDYSAANLKREQNTARLSEMTDEERSAEQMTYPVITVYDV